MLRDVERRNLPVTLARTMAEKYGSEPMEKQQKKTGQDKKPKNDTAEALEKIPKVDQQVKTSLGPPKLDFSNHSRKGAELRDRDREVRTAFEGSRRLNA